VLSVTVTAKMKDTMIGHQSEFEVTINSQHPEPLTGYRLHFNGSDYWQPASIAVGDIQAFSTMTVSITLVPKPAVANDVAQLSPSIDFHLRRSRVEISHTIALSLRSFHPDRFLERHKPDPKDGVINIACFGWAGSGKSAFIQTVLTALSDKPDPVRGAIRTGGEAKHVTNHFRRIAITSNICLWDTWGLDLKEYKSAEVKGLARGIFPDGWSRADSETDQKGLLNQHAVSAQHRRIHAVIFFVPIGSLDNEAELKIMREKWQEFGEENLNPILVLARIDDQIPLIRQNPLASNQALDDKMKLARLKFGIGDHMVLPTIPYAVAAKPHSAHLRAFALDCLAIKTVDVACQAAVEFCQHRAPDEYDFCSSSSRSSSAAPSSGSMASSSSSSSSSSS